VQAGGGGREGVGSQYVAAVCVTHRLRVARLGSPPCRGAPHRSTAARTRHVHDALEQRAQLGQVQLRARAKGDESQGKLRHVAQPRQVRLLDDAQHKRPGNCSAHKVPRDKRQRQVAREDHADPAGRNRHDKEGHPRRDDGAGACARVSHRCGPSAHSPEARRVHVVQQQLRRQRPRSRAGCQWTTRKPRQVGPRVGDARAGATKPAQTAGDVTKRLRAAPARNPEERTGAGSMAPRSKLHASLAKRRCKMCAAGSSRPRESQTTDHTRCFAANESS
jgi:hypothetical protein